jgi:hypothetical protein
MDSLSPFLQGSFIPCSMPVYPGALKLSLEPAEVGTIRNDDEQKAYERLQKPGWGQLWTATGSVGFAVQRAMQRR